MLPLSSNHSKCSSVAAVKLFIRCFINIRLVSPVHTTSERPHIIDQIAINPLDISLFKIIRCVRVFSLRLGVIP
ncbi:Uncharacterised protein [Vibrio cholerae]|nr:Uncharacterised protein [Vibrio cholerae]